MQALSRRTVLSLVVMAAAAGSTGCWGSFAITNKLYRFNDGVSDSKWIKWLLFLGLVILPVYSLFILGDALIFNTIEFWTGSNPFGAGGNREPPPPSPSPSPSPAPAKEPHKKKKGTLERDTDDPDLVRIDVGDVFYVKRTGDDFRLLDAERRPLAEVREEGGIATLRDGRGRVLARLSPEVVRKMSSRIEQIHSPQRALAEGLDDRAAPELVARASRARALL